MTISKEMLMHPDFITEFSYKLCKMLENIIDDEFEKGDETDFDFIDECADAINALRSGDNTQILPVISRREFLKKVGLKTERRFGILISACAAAAIIILAGGQIKVSENITVLQALSGIVSELFKDENHVKATQPETTTEKIRKLINISIETTDGFKTEYYVGEKFGAKGIKVFGEYDNGEKLLVNDYAVNVSDDFGKEAGYETVIISVGDFSSTLEVRIIESLETKKLTSIYAVFPDEINPESMQVFAVYSNGDERELSEDEYTVTREQNGSIFKKYVTVTVEYEGCSCSFNVEKEEQ